MNSSTYSYRKKKHHKKIEDDLLMINTSTKKHKIQALKQQIDMLSNEQPTHTRKRKKAKPVYKKPTTSMPMNKKGPYSIFISCLPGLEPLLLSEVQYLLQQANDTDTSDQKQSNKQIKKVPGGVTTIIPSLSYMHLLHLYLGTASHIYLRLNDNNPHAQIANIPSTFTALGFPELKRKIKDLIVAQRWDDLLLIPKKKKDGSNMAEEVVEASELPWKLSIHVTTSKSKLIHTKAVEERVLDVIGNLLGINGINEKDKNKEGDTKDDNRPTIRLLVRIERDEVQLSLDTSTSTNNSVSPMHMRGYRLDPYKAPLREDLAFALLLVGGVRPSWDLSQLDSLLGKKSSSIDMATEEKKEEQTGIQMFDPLCGSGTIAIEGASILAGLPPGRFRPPPLQGTTLYDEKLWNDMRSKALSVASDISKDREANTTVLVAANDINSNAILAAQANAQRAGVDHLISFQVGSFKTHSLLNPLRESSTVKTSSTSTPLKIVTNPPYGKRISSTTQSKSSSIYKQIAKSIRHSKLDNVECTLIGKDIRSLRESSLPLDVGFSTRHGGLGVIAMTSSSSAESKDG